MINLDQKIIHFLNKLEDNEKIRMLVSKAIIEKLCISRYLQLRERNPWV